MPSMRYRVQSIESQPYASDARTADASYVLDGRNYLFDSKGPKSGFSSKQLTPFSLGQQRDVQGLVIEGRSFVFTDDAVLSWRENVPFTWDLLYVFDTPMPESQRDPWNAVYIADRMFVSHRYRGTFEATVEPGTSRLLFYPRTSTHIPGLPTAIRGLELVRGRAVMVTDHTIYWSNTGSFTDLTPELGGAGLMNINQFTTGTFRAIVSFENGFVVWTTEGSVIAEYIGGDLVWRFYTGVSEEHPVSSWSTVRLSNGVSVFLSIHGLMVANSGKPPEAWTPEFNEFFRDYARENNSSLRMWRLEYDSSRELIFIMESTDRITYNRAFVLSPTIPKWGEFSERVFAFLPLTSNKYGFIDALGIPNYFLDAYGREVEPPNALGLNRFYPCIQKQLTTPSSSGICRAAAVDSTMPMSIELMAPAGWYYYGSDTPFAGYMAGLDSWIEIGYLRPQELNMSADAFIELQEFVIGSIPVAAPTPMDFTTSRNPDYFYGLPDEDWNSDPAFSTSDISEDYMTAAGDVDLRVAGIEPSEDNLCLLEYTATFTVVDSEDWDSLAGAEDWGGPVSGLNQLSHTISLRASQDGITFDECLPALSRFDTAAWTYAVQTGGNLHRLRIEAIEPGEYYAVKYLEMTVEYGGQLI